jgi:hypothetical protein
MNSSAAAFAFDWDASALDRVGGVGDRSIVAPAFGQKTSLGPMAWPCAGSRPSAAFVFDCDTSALDGRDESRRWAS